MLQSSEGPAVLLIAGIWVCDVFDLKNEMVHEAIHYSGAVVPLEQHADYIALFNYVFQHYVEYTVNLFMFDEVAATFMLRDMPVLEYQVGQAYASTKYCMPLIVSAMFQVYTYIRTIIKVMPDPRYMFLVRDYADGLFTIIATPKVNNVNTV